MSALLTKASWSLPSTLVLATRRIISTSVCYKKRKRSQEDDDDDEATRVAEQFTIRNMEELLVPMHLSSVVERTSSLQLLTRMAVGWTKAELEFYRTHVNDTSYKPSNGRNPSVARLQAAADEFCRRFTLVTLEGDEERAKVDEMTSMKGSPFLLVATNVRDNWVVPNKFYNSNSVRFMLVPGVTNDTSTLFIKCMAGPAHGKYDAYSTLDIDYWIRDNHLRDILEKMVNGGVGYTPDEAYGAKYPDKRDPQGDADDRLDGGPYARLVIEIDCTNRNADDLRAGGLFALSNPYTRLFVAVKIWPKCTNGSFSAAAILWGKDNQGIIRCRKAVDFGSKPLARISRRCFEQQGDLDAILPPVADWTRPQPLQGFDNLHLELASYTSSEEASNMPMTDDWCLTLPAEDMLFKTSTRQSTMEKPYVLGDVAIPDCYIDLKVLSWRIQE